MIHARDHQKRWYLIKRRGEAPDGDHLSSQKLCDIVRSHDDFWVLHLETDYAFRPDAARHTSTALIAKLVDDDGETKYTHSSMHIHIGPRLTVGQEMSEAAYQCAQQLAKSQPTHELADLGASDVDMESESHKDKLDAVIQEMDRLMAEREYNSALAAANRFSGKDLTLLFKAFVCQIFIRHYAILRTPTPSTQEWCVD